VAKNTPHKNYLSGYQHLINKYRLGFLLSSGFGPGNKIAPILVWINCG
jgi:hypothetical protein